MSPSLTVLLCNILPAYILLQRWVSEREFYIGGSTLLCQFIEPVTYVHCAFIFALQNIALGGYLDTRRNI